MFLCELNNKTEIIYIELTQACLCGVMRYEYYNNNTYNEFLNSAGRMQIPPLKMKCWLFKKEKTK